MFLLLVININLFQYISKYVIEVQYHEIQYVGNYISCLLLSVSDMIVMSYESKLRKNVVHHHANNFSFFLLRASAFLANI